MDMDELIDFQVEDHIHNCRLCFRPFTDHQKSVEITEIIEQKFFELTQFQVSIELQEEYKKISGKHFCFSLFRTKPFPTWSVYFARVT